MQVQVADESDSEMESDISSMSENIFFSKFIKLEGEILDMLDFLIIDEND